MKRIFFYFVVAAIVALAAVNLNFALKNESKVANLTLLGTESLAQGENEWICSLCGKNADNCTCGVVIECDSSYGWCGPNRGQCWNSTAPWWAPTVRCDFSGSMNDSCCILMP